MDPILRFIHQASYSASALREVITLVWSEASPFVKLRLSVVLGLVLAASVIAPLGAVALKLLVDHFTGTSTAGTLSIAFLICLYVLSQWLSRTIGEIRGLLYARAERRMFRALSEKLFGHVMQLPLRFHMERQTGALNQILENGLSGFQTILHHLVFTLLPVAAQLGTTVYILVRFNQPVFLGIFTATLVCYAVAFSFFAIRVSPSAKSASSSVINANAVMTDAILNYETVKLFTAERLMLDRVTNALKKTEDQWVDFYRRYAFNGLTVAALHASFLAVAIVYATHQVASGRMTLGDFVLVNTYMLQLIQPVETLGYAVQGLSQGAAMLDKMLELFRERPEMEQRSECIAVAGQGHLEFEAVEVAYRADRAILKGVSLTLPAGKTLAIVGGSGAGKSTIVRLLVRLIEPDGGRILLDGVPTSKWSLLKLRQAVAVVPQETLLFNETIRYNIGFGKYGSSQEEIETAARIANLHDFIMSLPERYETPVGERGVKLSGGERQRVSIARAALKHPRIYVFDEATSSLDSRTEQTILANIRDISRQSTTLIIAHRLSTVVHADEIVVLQDGKVAERGTHTVLMRQNLEYAALWYAQQRGHVAA